MGNLTHTVSGDIASFRSAARVPIESLKCHFKPKQDLHGYDRPWPGGGGKNLFNIDSPIEYGAYNSSTGIFTTGKNRIITDYIPINYNITYTMKINSNTDNLAFINYNLFDENKTWIGSRDTNNDTSFNGELTHTFIINLSTAKYIRIVLRDATDASTFINERTLQNSKLQIEIGSTATSYEPYENICPIEGWNNIEIQYSKKNLLDTTKNNRVGIYSQWSATNGTISTTSVTAWNSTHVWFTQVFTPGTYTISCDYSGTGSNGPRLICSKSIDGGTWNNSYQGYWKNFTGRSCTFTANENFSVALVFISRTDHNGESCTFYNVQLEKGSIATEYELYDGNIIPITFPVLGKNKLNPAYRDDTYSNNIIYYRENRITLPAGTYTLSTSTSNVSLYVYQGLNGQQTTLFVKYNASSLTFTLNEDTNDLWFNFYTGNGIDHTATCQLELNSDATTYEPYNPDNTVYGGYIDIAKGEIVATHILLENLWSEWTLHGTQTNTVRKYITPPYEIYSSSYYNYVSKISNIARYSYSWTELDETHFYVSSSTRIYMWLPINTDESTKVQVIGTLLNPIHYPLSKTELKTFLDQNNIWSNTNDTTEVSYQIHDSNMIKTVKKEIIAGSQPHIEISSGAMANFNTDMISKLNDAKIYINPIQDIHGQAIASPVLGKNLLNVSFNNKFGYDTFIGNTIERDTGIIINSYSSVNGGYWVKIKPNTTYTYSFNCTYSGSCLHARVWCFSEKPTSTTSLSADALVVNKTSFKNSETFTTLSDSEWALVGLYAYSSGLGSTLTNMQLEEGDTATAYEPYQGNFPITGMSEINIYNSGTNLLPAEEWSKTQNGLTFAYHSDGSVHIEGQWEKNTWLNIPESFYFKIPPGTYTLSGNTVGYDNTGIQLYLLINGKDIAFYDNGTSRTITTNGGDTRIQIGAYKNQNLNVTIYPQLEVGSTISSFDSNKLKKQTISLPRLGKNWYNATSVTKTQAGVTWTANNDYTITVAGTPTGYSMLTTGVNEIPSTGKICLSANFNELTNIAWDNYYIYNSNMELLESTGGGGSGYKVIDLDTYTDPKYIKLSFKRNSNNIEIKGTIQPMIEIGSTPTVYEPYNILYGGYIDLVNGKLYKTHNCIKITDVNNYTERSDGFWYSTATALQVPTIKNLNAGLICNRLHIVQNVGGDSPNGELTWYSNQIIRWREQRELTLAEYKNFLNENPLIVCYEMATPIEYPLTLQTLKTLKGVNNIWSNANGPIEVQYWTH